jgi:hypothetical protein
MIVLAAAAAALAGAELVSRRRLTVLGRCVLAGAPAEAALLLAANWREHVSEPYARVLVTATLFLLSGLLVAMLGLLADPGSRAGRRGFAAVATCVGALDVLALVVIWSRSLPGEALRALLSLVFLTLVLSVLTPLVQRHSRPH